MSERGTIGILNVGAGDIKLSFDKSNPMERARASRVLIDMLRRGYVIFIETGKDDGGNPTFQRVLEFLEDVCEYIIADLAGPVEEEAQHEQTAAGSGGAEPEEGRPTLRAPIATASVPKHRGRPRKSVDAGDVRAVAVPRTAGG